MRAKHDREKIGKTLYRCSSHYLFLILLIFFFPAIASTNTSNTGAEKTYLMGIFPHLPPRDLESVFSPMAADLAKVVNKPILLRTNTTFEKFSNNLDNEVFDIAFVQPFDYVRIADKYGYLPLAARSEKLAAILVVKGQSKYQDLVDFKGKHIALPPTTAAVSYLIKAHLIKNGLEPEKDVRISYHRSHVSCLQQVLIGEADACGTAAPAKRFFEHRMNTKLRVVSTTQPIPHTLFVVHPRIPEPERQQIMKRIIGWSESEDGRELLKRGRLVPFVPVKDEDYNIVRKMAARK